MKSRSTSVLRSERLLPFALGGLLVVALNTGLPAAGSGNVPGGAQIPGAGGAESLLGCFPNAPAAVRAELEARGGRAPEGSETAGALALEVAEAPEGSGAAVAAEGGGASDCNQNGVPDDEDLRPHFELEPVRAVASGGQNAIDVKAADMDGDGDPDLVVAHRNSNTVVTLRREAAGTYTLLPAASVATEAYLLEVGDFDGDLDVDVATASLGGQRVSVLANKGDGTFLAAKHVDLGWRIFAFGSGDFDGDGDLDLVASGGSDGLRVLANDGLGGFSLGPNISVCYPNSLAVGDVDRDGDLDIVVSSAPCDIAGNYAIAVVKNQGGGTFGAPARATTATWYIGMALADLDGDGDLDLACADLENQQVRVFRNGGSGNFSALRSLSVPSRPTGLDAADLDEDGDLDLAACAEGAGSAYVLLNAGSASFGSPLSFAAGGMAFRISAVDIDGDGDPDLVTANGYSHNVGVLVSDPSPTSADSNGNSIPDECELDCNWNSVPDDLDLANPGIPDCNSNGVPDECDIRPPLAFEDYRLQFVGLGTNVVDVAAGDFDLDGVLDVATANRAAGTVSVLSGKGDATFDLLPTAFAVGTGTFQMRAADFDLDGDLDVATMNPDSRDFSLLYNLGAGAGGAWKGFESARRYSLGTQPYGMDAGDLDGDGDLDIALACGNQAAQETPLVKVYRNNRATGFSSLGSLSIAPGSMDVAAGDLDGDGDVDLAAVSQSGESGHPGTLSILLNRGTGTIGFASAIKVPLETVPMSVSLGDMDGDGDLDVVTTDYATATLSVVSNAGGAAFGPQVSTVVAPGAFFALLRDLDDDGTLDILTATELRGSVWILKNRGGGSFGSPKEFRTGGMAFRAAAADFDGDGDLDIAAANGNDNAVAVLEREKLEPVSTDCGKNGVPDECDPPWANPDTNANGIPDACEPDCNANGLPDETDVRTGASRDCNSNGVPDECEADCDGNGTADACDIAEGPERLDCNGNGLLDSCEIGSGMLEDRDRNGIPDACEGTRFHRGDPNDDGKIDLSDGVRIFAYLFLGGDAPGCLEAANADNSADVDISDGIRILNYLFLGGPPPAAPGPPPDPCGMDPDPRDSPENLGCERYAHCP